MFANPLSAQISALSGATALIEISSDQGKLSAVVTVSDVL
jgi:hypothetical protein